MAAGRSRSTRKLRDWMVKQVVVCARLCVCVRMCVYRHFALLDPKKVQSGASKCKKKKLERGKNKNLSKQLLANNHYTEIGC